MTLNFVAGSPKVRYQDPRKHALQTPWKTLWTTPETRWEKQAARPPYIGTHRNALQVPSRHATGAPKTLWVPLNTATNTLQTFASTPRIGGRGERKGVKLMSGRRWTRQELRDVVTYKSNGQKYLSRDISGWNVIIRKGGLILWSKRCGWYK